MHERFRQNVFFRCKKPDAYQKKEVKKKEEEGSKEEDRQEGVDARNVKNEYVH